MCPVLVFFFFFQAEDGIRDLTVTGVQTCALPIWLVTCISTCTSGQRCRNWGMSSPSTVWARVTGQLTRMVPRGSVCTSRSEEHTSELQSQSNLVCRLLLEKKKKNKKNTILLICNT